MNHPRSELSALFPASVLGEGTERYDVVVIGFGISPPAPPSPCLTNIIVGTYCPGRGQ
jgi:hypothetical protein